MTTFDVSQQCVFEEHLQSLPKRFKKIERSGWCYFGNGNADYKASELHHMFLDVTNTEEENKAIFDDYLETVQWYYKIHFSVSVADKIKICAELLTLYDSDELFRKSVATWKATYHDEKCIKNGAPIIVVYPMMDEASVRYVFNICKAIQEKYDFKADGKPAFNIHVTGGLFYAGGDRTEKKEILEGIEIAKNLKEGELAPRNRRFVTKFGSLIRENLYSDDLCLFKNQIKL